MCSAQYAYIVPYTYGMITYPVREWASHMRMHNTLLYCVEITLRGFHAQCSSICYKPIWIANTGQPAMHARARIARRVHHTYTL